MTPDGRANQPELPQQPGYYLWYVLDLSYLEVGCIRVSRDNPEHLKYLREERLGSRDFYVYENKAGETLTMYHQAAPHRTPTTDQDGKPLVDGYVTFDLDQIDPPPIKLEPRLLKTRQ